MEARAFRSWPLFWFTLVGCLVPAVAVALMLADAPANSSAPPQTATDKVMVAAFFVALLLPMLWALRGRVKVSDDGVTFVGYTSTRHIPWTRISGASVDWYGLHLLLIDGRTVRSVFVQKPVWDDVLSRRGYADRVAELIEHEAARRRLG